MMNTDRLSKLDFKRLDRKLSLEEKQEWEMIYASFRSGSVLTGTVVGNDLMKLYEQGEVLSLTIINYRVKIMIPYRVIIVIKKYNYERKLIFGRILARW